MPVFLRRNKRILSPEDRYLKLAIEQINFENEAEISKRDENLKKVETSINRCQSKMDNLV